jgi:hypothetical protein
LTFAIIIHPTPSASMDNVYQRKNNKHSNPFFWMRYRATTGALIKDHSSISWHLLRLDESTLRTGNDGIQFDFHTYNSPLNA